LPLKLNPKNGAVSVSDKMATVCVFVSLVFVLVGVMEVGGKPLCGVCNCEDAEVVDCSGLGLRQVPVLELGNVPSSVIFVNNPLLLCVDLRAWETKTGVVTVTDQCTSTVPESTTVPVVPESTTVRPLPTVRWPETSATPVVEGAEYMQWEIRIMLGLCLLVCCVTLIVVSCCFFQLKTEIRRRQPPRMRFHREREHEVVRVTDSDSDDEKQVSR
jgi:hypothetical protein